MPNGNSTNNETNLNCLPTQVPTMLSDDLLPNKIVKWRDKIKDNMDQSTQWIKWRPWQLIGHVLRMNANEHPRLALTWTLKEAVEREGLQKHGNNLWRGIWGSWVLKVGCMPVLVLRTKKLDEREHKALFLLYTKIHDNDDINCIELGNC